MKKMKLIWAINPYETSEEMDSRVVAFLEKLSGVSPIEIQPAFVMTSGFSQIMQYFKDLTYENIVRRAQSDCENYLKKFSNMNILPLQLIENGVAFKSAEVRSFMAYLRAAKPDYVCISSQGKTKTNGLLIGSFAESYLRQSEFLTFVVGPRFSSSTSLTSAVVPLEVTQDSSTFISEAIANPKFSFFKKIKLFHKITFEDQFLLRNSDLTVDGGLTREDLSKLAQDVVQKNFDQIMSSTTAQDLSCMVTHSEESISASILDAAKQSQAGLIVMRSTTGPFLEAFVGSITKEVISGAAACVAIYPFNYKQK